MAARNTHIDVYLVDVPGVVLPRACFDRDPARNHTAIQLFELRDPLTDIALDGVRAFHIVKCDFERTIHWPVLDRWGCRSENVPPVAGLLTSLPLASQPFYNE